MQQSPSVVITGGSSGVGRAVAIRFARAGARLAIIARSPAGLESAKRDVEAEGAAAEIFAVDVSDWRSLSKVADEIAARSGIDIWINNAMSTMFAPVSQMTADEFSRITAVTYVGYVYGTMAALKHMRMRDHGVIVQVGSALSYRAIPLQSAYCGAKFAIRAFTDSLRSELRRDRCKVGLTMVQLPAVNTPQFDWARNRCDRRVRPMAPVFRPEHVAAVIYKASHDAPREVWIGTPVLKVVAGAMIAPAFLDRYLARTAYEGQLTGETRLDDGAGNLYRPMGGHAIHGRFSAEARDRPPLAFNPKWLRLCAGAFAILLALYAASTAILSLT